MRRLPPEPQVGDRITAELVRELIRCIRERQLLKGPNYSLSTGPNGTYLKLDLPQKQIFPHEPLPYEVRWAQTENDGEGAWVIWFPTEETYKNIQNPVLMVGTIRITASEVTDADTLPLGWKILPNAAAGGDVWLRVDVPRGAGLDDPDWSSNISAAFKTQDDTPSYNPTDQYTHFAIPIAKAWTDQNSGAKHVRQYVTSLVKLSVNTDKEGGDGGGDGGDGGESTPQPFDIENDMVVRCYSSAPCGIMLVGANYAIDGTKGDILVHVDRDSKTGVYTLSVDQTSRAESPTHHEWTLYQYQGGEVTCDCRPRVLPLVRFDDKSLDIDETNHNLQIKSFDDPTNAASSTSLANDLQAETAVEGYVLFRNSQGGLEYKSIGQLASDVNLTDQTVLTGLSWNQSTHTLEISYAKMTVQKGLITDWDPQSMQEISTTAISDILPSQSGS